MKITSSNPHFSCSKPLAKISMKKKIGKASLFILGVLVTLILSTTWNKVFPENPIIVKEVKDSLTVIHSYDFKQGDSLNSEIKNRIENLELLDSYEREIDKRIKKLDKSANEFIKPNLLMINNSLNLNSWIQRKSSSFFEMSCPEKLESRFLDFEINLLHPELSSEIAAFRVLIYKYNELHDESIYLDDYYEVSKNRKNLIRISSDFSKGKYHILVGLILKKDAKSKSPIFYRHTCVYTK